MPAVPTAAAKAALPPPCFTPVDFVPLGDGTFRAIPRKPVQVGSISDAMKLTGLERKLVWRLYRTRFIEGTQVSPKKILIYLPSLFAHIEAGKEEGFWTRARKRQFDSVH